MFTVELRKSKNWPQCKVKLAQITFLFSLIDLHKCTTSACLLFRNDTRYFFHCVTLDMTEHLYRAL